MRPAGKHVRNWPRSSSLSLLIDNDMLGSINRNVRGIEVNDETLSLDVIANVCIEGRDTIWAMTRRFPSCRRNISIRSSATA